MPKVKVNASQSGIYVCNYNGVGSFVAISDHKEINVTTSYYIMAISVALMIQSISKNVFSYLCFPIYHG